MKYRKKPVVIEAFKFGVDPMPDWFMDEVTKNEIILRNCRQEMHPIEDYRCEINTLEGVMTGIGGDYIIQGVNGEIYPCKPDIFEKSYEAVMPFEDYVEEQFQNHAEMEKRHEEFSKKVDEKRVDIKKRWEERSKKRGRW